jgi:MFS family permease
MWFFGVVWLYFYRLYVTDQQVGLLDGIAFAIGLVAEVPSGALADKFGRDRMVRLGQVFIAGGILVQVLGHSFTAFVIGQAIMMIGFSLISGADDALFFEKLGFDQDSTQ